MSVATATTTTTTTNSAIHQFNHISLGGRIGGTRGVLKINVSGLAWKSEAGRSETVTSEDIQNASWIRVTPKLYQLNLAVKGGTQVKFDGFREQDYDFLKKFISENYKIELAVKELSTKGSNFGIAKVTSSMVSFQIDKKTAFEFPISDVSQSIINANNKNELTIEFLHDSTLDEVDESIVELRFFAPTRQTKEGDEHEETDDPIQDFQDTLLRKSDISNVGKSIVVLNDIHFLTPRGRFDIEMYPTFLRLHGKTHDYKVSYDTISKLFQLPRQDQSHMFFVISLDPPVRQGKTKYNHLVIQLSKDTQLSKENNNVLHLNLSPEAEEKYKEKLSPTMEGTLYVIVRRILTSLTENKIIVPGNFQSCNQSNSIKCSLKANEGYLYPLDRSFFFIHKPPTLIKYTDIQIVEFSRAPVAFGSRNTSNSRTFDLNITLKDSTTIQFTNILKEEYSLLFNFIQNKQIKIATPEQNVSNMRMMDAQDDDSDDEDYEPSSEDESSDEEEEEESEAEKKSKKKQKKE
ncbi:structure-specific recognition protein 1 [Heterostelium album PN500]|uniref:FACT complex subunit SSRP1 n=1 Tax=Heterostelium pallidum (strain ATCC 26659 / Pp 5 / PN500) TaxID=670386 RepID=D3AXH6_HETP5|nr:structure-specific recognition protein 1 [Heterostelium album PN500]EFA86245.1 structure-specific recognition protein 1 [Heterostelium album PN500]|eukprot:XP_020438350.1 structure-specific recognition protein 1 [Heterostelium album PN500]